MNSVKELVLTSLRWHLYYFLMISLTSLVKVVIVSSYHHFNLWIKILRHTFIYSNSVDTISNFIKIFLDRTECLTIIKFQILLTEQIL